GSKREEGVPALRENAPPTSRGRYCAGPLDAPFQHRENGFDDYQKQVLLPHKMSQFGPALTKGDLNGDGWEDFMIGGGMGQAGAVYLQQAEGFVPMPQPILEEDRVFEDLDAELFDADGDGDLDLYVVSGGNALKPNSGLYQDRLYINDGKGNLSRNIEALPSCYDSGSCVRPADIDQDGDLDLFVGGRHLPWSYPEPANSRILLNEGGRFRDVTESWAPDFLPLGLVTDAQWTDYNQDGLLDLMIVGEWMPITLFEQQADQRFTKVAVDGLDQTNGWWYSLLAQDLDGDGKDEYVAGNLGQNYKYQSSETEPFEVFYNDFDNNGTKDIVLSYYNFGEKFPLRGRSCSSQQVPMLKKKFPTYDLFADSDLESIYGERKLNTSLQYQAETFASVCLQPKADGGFAVRPLPNEAQVSSINVSLAEDFDQDGQLELLIAGNLYTSEVETPRNDAGVGLLMKGNLAEGWQVMPSKESGVMLPYDVKDMVSLNRPDGSRWIVVACNDDQLRLLATRAPNRSQNGK
ncbi:MAG: FG-GAP-like repeat-containing protein, partial [Bacteroidota bacterium]